MPIARDDTKAENFNKALNRGDLYIKFDIQFPTSLTEDQKEAVKQYLSDEQILNKNEYSTKIYMNQRSI